MNRNIYFLVCIIILSFTLCIITQVIADTEPLPTPQKELPPPIDENNNNSDQLTAENLKALLGPIAITFNILYILISYLWTFILYVLSPAFWMLRVIYVVFIQTPYDITQKINSYFYPLYMFLITAALIGVFVGGTAGWFSEIIAKLLISPTSEELEQEENRVKAEKLRRRAQALANYKAKNGRMPDEFYEKYEKYYNNTQNKQAMIQQKGMMEDYYNSMDYRSYAGTGVGESY